MSERPPHLALGERPPTAGGGLMRAVAARVEEFLLEPAAGTGERAERGVQVRARPVVAVVAAAPGCGTTTVARAVAAELAARDPAGAAAVCGRFGPGPPIASPAARRLARRVEAVAGGRTRAAGRLCLSHDCDRVALVAGVRAHAPVVLEAAYGSAPLDLVSLADAVIVVSGPLSEPALAAVVAATLGRAGPTPLTVLNRGPDGEAAAHWHAVLPDSRAAARAALAGYATHGWFGQAIAGLVERIG